LCHKELIPLFFKELLQIRKKNDHY
jgi:hypothetical protein